MSYDPTYPPDTGGDFDTFAALMRANQSAIATMSKGPTAPAVAEVGELWLDDAVSPHRLWVCTVAGPPPTFARANVTIADLAGGGGGLTSPVGIADGGTGATSAGAARTALGVPAIAHTHAEADVTGLVADLAAKAAASHSHAPGDITGTAVVTADARLSDARTPLAHAHAEADVTGLVADLAAKAAASHTHPASDVVSGVLPIARLATGTPDGTKFVRDDGTLAVPAGGGGGTPATTVTDETAFGIAPAVGSSGNYARQDHTHGSPTNPITAHVAAGDPHTGYQLESEKAAASGYASLDGATKVPIAQIPTGSTGSTVPFGNDARLSDARTPTAHATSHKSGGADAVKLDELAAPTDITTLDASTSAHGLLPKLPGGTTTFLRADGTFAAPSGGAVFDPETTLAYYDDFLGSTSLTAPATGALIGYAVPWWWLGASPNVAGVGGLATVDGDATTQGGMYAARGTGAFQVFTNTTKRFDLRFRCAQKGTVAGTRRFGLGAAALNADGTGIYVRHTNAGNYFLVGRTGASETTLDSGVAAANGTYHTFRLVATADQTVELFVDGVSKGTVTGANIPTADLGLGAWAGATGANTGLTLDYIHMRATR